MCLKGKRLGSIRKVRDQGACLSAQRQGSRGICRKEGADPNRRRDSAPLESGKEEKSWGQSQRSSGRGRTRRWSEVICWEEMVQSWGTSGDSEKMTKT